MEKFGFTGVIIDAKRRKMSENGNPSYWLTIRTMDNKTIKARTANNAQCAYSCTNGLGKRIHIFMAHTTPNKHIVIDTID